MSLESNDNNECKQFAFDLNVKPVEDDNSDFPQNSDSCTICLELLFNSRDDHRTLVTLTCGHKFHLDCIGSAFNAKGFMQCPNCMQIEPGQWRYATNHPIPNISEDDWNGEEEEEAYSDRFPEMELCPYEGLIRLRDYSQAPQSSVTASVGQHFNRQWITAIEDVRQRAPPSNRLVLSRALEPGVMTERHYLAHPSFHHILSFPNAPQFLSYRNTSTMQVNQIPSLFDDLSAPVSVGHMFLSGREQVPRGISHSWANLTHQLRPNLFRSSSRGAGTIDNNGGGNGVTSSDGGRGGGGNGNGNGLSGGSH